MSASLFSSGGSAVEPPRFPSFFGGGFECSTFIRKSGERVDMIAASGHDRFVEADYRRLVDQGMRIAREGVRWHLAEHAPGEYDFSTVLPMLRAARRYGVQVVWDLCHFGWPDGLDLFSPEFPSQLAEYGAAFAGWLRTHDDAPGWFVPVNEISFFSWASGDEGSMYPFATGRGFELKLQLVRAAVQTIDAIRAVAPGARFIHVDPIIHVAAHPDHPDERAAAEAYHEAQFQAFDMLAGRAAPECGGAGRHLDIIGVNYYPHNQWYYDIEGTRRIREWQAIPRRSPAYRPFREMLVEVYRRFHRPIFIAETGAETRKRRPWFRHVCEETQAALAAGVPITGICLYPILNHPGWVDDRHCENGLWDYADRHGRRQLYQPLAAELRKWTAVFDQSQRFLARRPSRSAVASPAVAA